MTCTGRCCQRIVLHSTEADALGYPCTPRWWLRVWIERDRQEEAAKIWRVLRLVETDADGVDWHRCAALGPTGCTEPREHRPQMCNDFPYAGALPCRHCGARSDQEARAVALVLHFSLVGVVGPIPPDETPARRDASPVASANPSVSPT